MGSKSLGMIVFNNRLQIDYNMLYLYSTRRLGFGLLNERRGIHTAFEGTPRTAPQHNDHRSPSPPGGEKRQYGCQRVAQHDDQKYQGRKRF